MRGDHPEAYGQIKLFGLNVYIALISGHYDYFRGILSYEMFQYPQS